MNARFQKKASSSGAVLRGALVAALALSVGCEGCGAPKGDSALVEMAAPNAQIAFTTGDLVSTAGEIRAFFDAATKNSGPMAASVENAAQQQLGFNPFDPKGYAEVGIDPKAGMMFFTEGLSPAAVLALRVSDQKKVATWIAATLKRLDGATELKQEKEEGLDISTVGRPFGTELVPVSHWTFVKDLVLVSQADGKASLINAAKRIQARKADAPSLKGDALYSKLVGKIAEDSAFKLFLRGTAAKAVTGSAPSELSKGAALGMSFSSTGFGADFFVDFAVPGLAEAMSGAAPADLAKQVGEDALVAMVTRSANPAALDVLRKEPTLASVIDTALAAFDREAGMSAKDDVLPLLAGPLTSGLYLMDAQKAFGTLQRGGMNPNAMLDVVHASVTAEIKDRAKMLALLDQAKEKLETPNLKFKKLDEERNGKPLTRYVPDRPEPKLGWALYGTTYVYGAGPGRLDMMLDVIDGKSPGMTLAGPASALGQKKGASVFVLRIGEVGERAGALASELGAAGPMLGQIVTSAVNTAKKLGDVAVALEADKDGLRLSVREELSR
ncbi:MAG: hypothetical protein AAFQ82_05820 [Myxococcota bacterium]